VWSLRDRAAILAACVAHIEAAERSLFAAVWDEEIPELRTALEQTSARGVDVHVAVYGTEALHGPVSYDLADCGESARQLSVVVADFRDAIITEFGTAGGDEAVVTNNAVLSLLAVEYVKSDVLGRLLIDAMGDPLYREVRENPLTRALLE
jgi:HTH-type transcriptional regulator, sugar sensing transcriptional regulator